MEELNERRRRETESFSTFMEVHTSSALWILIDIRSNVMVSPLLLFLA